MKMKPPLRYHLRIARGIERDPQYVCTISSPAIKMLIQKYEKILDLKLKEDSLGRIHPDNHKVMWAFGAETLSRHLPTLINGKIDHLLAIIKFTAEAGHNPSIDTFNDFFDQVSFGLARGD